MSVGEVREGIAPGGAPASGPATGASAPLRVLVVDDDAATRLVLASAVEVAGHTVATAGDGEEAWRVWNASHFDIILADGRMPRLDGYELCRRIRERESESESAYTYFVFVSALDDREHRLQGARAGADDYLTKPVDLDALDAQLVAAARVTALHRRLAETARVLRTDSERSFRAARTDALTALGNRRKLDEDLERAEALARRYGHRFACALCDVDLFKKFNDRYGHLAGDEALRKVAEALASELRKGDEVYRFGGEEFLVLLPEQGVEEAAEAMDRVRAAVERLAIPHEDTTTGRLTLSVGVAELSFRAGEDREAGIARADAALYRAKAQGRNRVFSERPAA
jgi:two-component system chemotaxis response regulator CheY